MLLDQRQTIDLIIVGERIVILGDETKRLFAAKLLERFQPEVPVEQVIGAAPATLWMYDQRLDHAHFANRCEHRTVFAKRKIRRFELPDRVNGRKRNGDPLQIECGVNGCTHATFLARSAKNFGIVSIFSARSRFT